MEILSFFSRSVPCKKNVRPRDVIPYPGKEEYSLVDGTFFRTSKNGNLVISGEDVNRVGYADDELVTLLKQKSFSLNGYPSYLIENLMKLALIKSEQTSRLNYHEHHVADNRLPYYARLEITDNCQCACTFCYKKEQKMQDPSLEILKRRIRHLKELGIVRLEILGGEPFIRKDIAELCNFIAEEKMLYTITTNGEYIKNLSEAQLNTLRTAKNITISLDSYGKYHDEGRKREGLFDAVIQGIRILKEKNIPVSIISTINTNNIDGLEQLITFMEPYHIPHTIRPTILSGEAKDNNLQNLSMKEILENHKDNKYLRHT
ncbi:MAG: radical SAM protein, partial [Pseudomonadota bacterium]|nr:radical SAM protein [Pseudomonadota bacterium]